MTLLDRINLGYIWLKANSSEKKRWQEIEKKTVSAPLVFYGYESIPSTDTQVFGGMVKLQDLQKTFPNQTQQPNILYLVSSALPYFSVRMARMAKNAGAKLVINQNGVAYPGWHGEGWQRTNSSMQELIGLADYVFYQSKFCKLAADKFIGECAGNHEILYNAVDTRTFTPGKGLKKDDEAITLLLSGSHWSFYRPCSAIEILQKIRQIDKRVVLKIAGRFCWDRDRDLAKKQVMGFAHRLGVENHIEYIGSYTQQEAVSLFQNSTILLHTKYNDPCPRLVLEAMACGLPVVYSDTGGLPELVGNEGGVGIPSPLDWNKDHPPNINDMVDGVLQVISELPKYSIAARQRAVKLFDIEKWMKKHNEVFCSLL